MSRSTPKKSAAKVAAPMDDSVREAKVGTPATNTARACYAAKTLVAEVIDLFPETPAEYSKYDGRNTALDVTFDLTAVSMPDDDLLASLLELTSTDARVREVVMEDGTVLVSFRSNPITQDLRDPFGLSEALLVLTSAEDDDETDSLTEPPAGDSYASVVLADQPTAHWRLVEGSS